LQLLVAAYDLREKGREREKEEPRMIEDAEATHEIMSLI
jgi:hypothetical protein